MHLGPPLTLGWREPDRGALNSARLQRGDIHICPPDKPFFQSWDAAMRVLIIAFDRGWASRTTKGLAPIAMPLVLGASDATVERFAALFDQEISDRGRRGPLYLEGLATALLAHAVGTYAVVPPRPRPTVGGLTPLQLRRVIDYVEAELGAEIAVTDLAAIARVSPHHFAHAFKRTTGASPHRYVVERRVHRARELASASDLPLAQIAAATGFSSQSHMTSSFRKIIGATPAQFRRAVRDPPSRHASPRLPPRRAQ